MTHHAKMAMSDSQHYPKKLCLIKYESTIKWQIYITSLTTSFLISRLNMLVLLLLLISRLTNLSGLRISHLKAPISDQLRLLNLLLQGYPARMRL